MADILSDFGGDASTSQAPGATNGGKQDPKPTSYSPPTGRAGSTSGPGLGGDNCGTCGTQGRH